MTTQEEFQKQSDILIKLGSEIRPQVDKILNDRRRIRAVEGILEGIEFKGTIHQIRELVNDPKWDDKV